MFRTGIRRFIFLLTPLVTVIGPAVGVYLKVVGQNPSWFVIGLFAVALLICAGIASYYNVVKPLRDPDKMIQVLLAAIGNRIISYGASHGVTLRLNIILAYRPARQLFRHEMFRVRWSLGMQYSKDGAAEFSVEKGVAGAAYSSGNTMIVNMEVPGNREAWKFTPEELEKFPKHTMIWSYPIYELDKGDSPTGHTLGTVNLDSLTAKAFDAIFNDPEYAVMMEEFRDIVSKVASC